MGKIDRRELLYSILNLPPERTAMLKIKKTYVEEIGKIHRWLDKKINGATDGYMVVKILAKADEKYVKLNKWYDNALRELFKHVNGYEELVTTFRKYEKQFIEKQ